MASVLKARYPGPQPFSDDDLSRKIFFGRDGEREKLTNQIMGNRLVVVFSRSGLGKTSLLNAGLADRLRDEGFLPLPVRINDTTKGPLQSIYTGIEEASKRQRIEHLPGSQVTLWHYFKTVQFWREDLLLTPVLILDQFEELFSLQSEDRRRSFVDELSFLVRGVRPSRTDNMPFEESRGSEDPKTSWSDSVPVVRVVVSIREDFVGHLEDLAESIPQILDNRFRLISFSRQAAAEAIEKPGSVADPAFSTRPFTYNQGAIGQILDFLSRRAALDRVHTGEEVEPFQLQLVCQYVEEFVKKKQDLQDAQIEVTAHDIGGSAALSKLFKNFYHLQLQAVPNRRERKAVRTLCERNLISPAGRRLSVDESEIERLLQIKPSTLQTLVERRLLRADSRANSTYYELSHDSLIAPILASRRLQFRLSGALLRVSAWALLFLGIGFIITGGTFLSWYLLGGPPLGDYTKGPEWSIFYLFFGPIFFLGGRHALRRAKEFREKVRISEFQKDL